jgi:hypothetical protein
MDGENRMNGEDSWFLPNTSKHVSDYAVLFTQKKKKKASSIYDSTHAWRDNIF